MAIGKKSFILYVDLIHTVKKMPDDKAGLLFKTILSYVNDEDPIPDDMIVDLTFEPIKQQLKRDLKQWNEFKIKQSENGKKGGRPKKPKPLIENPKNPSLNLETQKSLNVTVNVNDTVNDNVNDNVKEKRKTKVFTPPFYFEVEDYFTENGYTIQSAKKAWDYYEAGNWKDSKGNQVKNWKQKMQGVWFKPENQKAEKPKIELDHNNLPIVKPIAK